MKKIALALSFLLALAACRDEAPDEAPPVGRSLAGIVAASPAMATPSGVAVAAASDPRARVHAYRRATALAQEALDQAWNRCDETTGDELVRCRDEAVVAYDAAVASAHATWGEDIEALEAGMPGVLDHQDGVAVVQVTGIRG